MRGGTGGPRGRSDAAGGSFASGGGAAAGRSGAAYGGTDGDEAPSERANGLAERTDGGADGVDGGASCPEMDVDYCVGCQMEFSGARSAVDHAGAITRAIALIVFQFRVVTGTPKTRSSAPR